MSLFISERGRPRLAGAISLAAGVLLLWAEAIADGGLDNVRLKLVNGSSIRASIQSIDSNGKIVGDAIIKDIVLDRILTLETGRNVEPFLGPIELQLRIGGSLTVDLLKLQDEKMVVEQGKHSMTLPLETVGAVVWRSNETVRSAASNPSNEHDTLVVATDRGERLVTGILESIDATHVVINYQGESRRIALEKISAIIPARLKTDELQGVRGMVWTVEGNRLTGVIEEYHSNVLHLRMTSAFRLPISAETISRIEIHSERQLFLSDLEPIRSESHVYFAAERPWQRDRSVLGNRLRLKYWSTGRVLEFEKGLGTRSFTSIVFRNQGFNNLRAMVGIDLETVGNGDCEMTIEGDGILLWHKRVRATDDPEPISIDIKNIDEIALIVWPGEGFDLADHANWADARFTKTD
jgi:hypothetical protein